MSVGGRKENGRLRHYDGIRRLKATYVIVTGRLATNVVAVACQPANLAASVSARSEGKTSPPAHCAGGRAQRGVLKWITLAETGSGYGVDGTSSVHGAGP